MNDRLRTLMYDLFADDPRRRISLVKLWHSPWINASKKLHSRLANVFEEFVTLLLYDPLSFRLRTDRFCLLGNGCDALAIRYDWLHRKAERAVIIDAFAERKTLFRTVKEFGQQFACDDYQGVGSTVGWINPVWRREMVRDFAWMCLAKGDSYIVVELIAALQGCMLEHVQGRKDVFLSALHHGMQNMSNVKEVLCFGLTSWDRHPEDIEQERERNKKIK